MLIDPRGRPLRLLPDARRKLSIRREMRTGLAFLIGNLGADGELRVTPGGQAVLKLRLACTDRYQKDNVWQDRTEWVRVTIWGRRGEALAANFISSRRGRARHKYLARRQTWPAEN